MATKMTEPATAGGESQAKELPKVKSGGAARLMLGIAAAVLVLVAISLPIWQANLSAPQYPQGLGLTAYGHGVVGDIREINELNHYVGMQAFQASNVPEMKLWVPAILAALVLVIVATLGWRRWWGRLAGIGLWMVPIFAMADIQYRLYQYGHSVSPTAPIRIPPFTPLVLGRTHVLNFTTWAYPGPALWMLFGAAFLVTLGPGIVRRIRRRATAEAG